MTLFFRVQDFFGIIFFKKNFNSRIIPFHNFFSDSAIFAVDMANSERNDELRKKCAKEFCIDFTNEKKWLRVEGFRVLSFA